MEAGEHRPVLTGAGGIGTGAGWKQKEIRHRPAGMIKPQDLVLIKVSPQRRGKRWEPNADG